MAIGAFPLIKLGALALRQISKPLANHLKTRAKSSDFFKFRICMPPAQFYHWCEVNVKARLLNLGKPKEVVKLNEQAAIDLGAELIGELVMFLIAAATITAEYTRQSRKYADEKATLEARWMSIENKVSQIEEQLDSSLKQINSLEKKTRECTEGKGQEVSLVAGKLIRLFTEYEFSRYLQSLVD